jgi:hypothetical protein
MEIPGSWLGSRRAARRAAAMPSSWRPTALFRITPFRKTASGELGGDLQRPLRVARAPSQSRRWKNSAEASALRIGEGGRARGRGGRTARRSLHGLGSRQVEAQQPSVRESGMGLGMLRDLLDHRQEELGGATWSRSPGPPRAPAPTDSGLRGSGSGTPRVPPGERAAPRRRGGASPGAESLSLSATAAPETPRGSGHDRDPTTRAPARAFPDGGGRIADTDRRQEPVSHSRDGLDVSGCRHFVARA